MYGTGIFPLIFVSVILVVVYLPVVKTLCTLVALGVRYSSFVVKFGG